MTTMTTSTGNTLTVDADAMLLRIGGDLDTADAILDSELEAALEGTGLEICGVADTDAYRLREIESEPTAAASISWEETPFAAANVYVSDGVLGTWAQVPSEWTAAQVRAAYLAYADYDETPRLEVTFRPEGGPAFAHECFRGTVEESGAED